MTSKWRDKYKVHPAADVFPMMSDEEIDGLVKANGLREQVVFTVDEELLEGRNRMEACERNGIEEVASCHLPSGLDPVAYVISKNLKRRHMTKAQIADAIVALAKIKPEQKPGQADPVCDDDHVQIFTACGTPSKAYLSKEFIEEEVAKQKGGRGKRNPVKAKALELNKALPKEDQVSEKTIKRAIAEAEGKKPKAKPKPKAEFKVRATVSDQTLLAEVIATTCGELMPATFSAMTKAERDETLKNLEDAMAVLVPAIDKLKSLIETKAIGNDKDHHANKDCPDCHGTGTITSAKTGTEMS